MLLSPPSVLAKTLKLEIEERKFGKSEIPVEVVLPNTVVKKPTSDYNPTWKHLDAEIGSKVELTNTVRGFSESDKRGFAVAVIDAFHTHDIKPNQKHRQQWLPIVQRACGFLE